ncbi:hypothetical protein QTP70_012479 [Hemibagrus guttatus]|uniref:Transmembrane protein 63C n=1 Tax=Hemibagrus guttatus TaxID=175788 RepID=A0AAE0V2T4_9TELE|nr:hypothetical protein QTP70_012479 [Hemibagrus guttatus]
MYKQLATAQSLLVYSNALTVCRLTEIQAIAMAVYSNSLATVSPAFEPWSTASVDQDVLHLLGSATEENSTAERCYLSHSRSSVLQGLPFGGVPTVLAINLILWLFLLLVFSCVRKAAWDYGRLALLMENDRDEEIRKNSPQNFGRTTVANIAAQNSFLWTHSIFALLYFVITVLCMVHHSSQLEYKEDEKVARSLMITNIPKEISDPGLITKHFQRKAMKGRMYFTTKSQKEGRIMIKTHPCAQIFCCDLCGFEQIDAEQYYSELEEKLTDEFNAEKNRITMKRLGIAFVTFRDERMTAVIVKDYRRARCRRKPQQSSITTVVHSHQWGVCYAPAPNDIIWENLSVSGSRWWLRCVLLNILLFLLLFFLTTPAIIVNTMDKFNVTRPVESLQNPVITQFFPTLLLWTFSVLLPFIVYYSSFFEYHWTRSSENQITMHKCFLLLVFMVIILPSLGLSSLDLFFRWLFDTHFLDQKDVKFQCVFLPDNGAFFVNYVITSSLIGTAMELLRIPSLLIYSLRLCFAKSKAERIHVKRSQAYEFQFGLEYAWTMCIFSVSMTYSITCPIIVPFGLLYLILKHLVDRYNIYYAYIPTKLSQHIHSAAIRQVLVAPILCMFWLLFFSVLRLGPVQPITLFTFISALLCIIFSVFGICLKKLQTDRSTSYQLFIASVLLEPELGLTPMPSPAHQSYGTMGNCQASVHEEEGAVGKDVEETVETELEDTPGPVCASSLMDSPVDYQ